MLWGSLLELLGGGTGLRSFSSVAQEETKAAITAAAKILRMAGP